MPLEMSSNVVLIKNNPWDAAIRAALTTAVLKGQSKPQLNIGDFNFTLAPSYGSNPDYIYVKHKGKYIGKIKGERVQLNIPPEDTDTVIALAAVFNMEQQELYVEAVKYGRKTGICSCCGRTLTNGESIKLGIGPICREKYGWATFIAEAVEKAPLTETEDAMLAKLM
jgi:hypothetical protein